jgi:siroheme synthase
VNPIVLVGAGPGGPEHLTQAAYHALQHAEVVLYDTLIDPRLLTLVPPQAEIRSVQGLSQTEINNLLIHYYRNQRRVVRLKSGDPFVLAKPLRNCRHWPQPIVCTMSFQVSAQSPGRPP